MKRRTAIILMLALCLSLFGGCKTTIEYVSRTITTSTALTEDQLFRIGKDVFNVDEAKVFLLSEKSRMAGVYGDQIFGVLSGGQTIGAYMKEDLKNFLTKMMILNQMAADKGLVLNQTEEDRILAAATEFYNGLTTEDKQYLNATQESVELAFRHYYWMQKMINSVAEGMNLEISDDEARVIQVQQIVVSSIEKAEQVMSKIQDGSEFANLSAVYNESPVFDRTLTRNDIDDTYENAVFSLSNGEYSTIFSSGDQFYIVKVINNYIVDQTMANKTTIANQMVTEQMNAEYSHYLETLEPTLFNDDAWGALTFEDGYLLGGSSFYTVYSHVFS